MKNGEVFKTDAGCKLVVDDAVKPGSADTNENDLQGFYQVSKIMKPSVA